MTHAMTSSSFFRTLAQAACLTAAALSFPAAASVIINGTRVIYNGAEKEVSVRLTNTGTQPVLVQSWTDEGDANATPDRIRTPFTLSPPINRINAGKAQTVRLSYTGVPALPQDRESVYWLNVLEVPAAKQDETLSRLQVAFRSRIKLFYRPAALANREQVRAGAEGLTWTVSGQTLTASNASPYFVSLVSVSLKGAGKGGSVEGEMVPPKGKQTFTLPKTARAGAGTVLVYEYVNDWGALRKVEYTL
ncbi:putative fimbrial chaperone YadV [Klebsiella spallanzanii]|uniref:Fimbrial chaperone YadV n=1 Tax=Klebsiella spallanzanii TaxID=2587528 RepID=A0ABY6VJQ2_9ENTR|nr:fimbria/pilus periplasmic chaperone [Klebsiella spallanzanii]VUS85369.1 putative fimbrial chaperone YadV [Klebsiella spallanzanii]